MINWLELLFDEIVFFSLASPSAGVCARGSENFPMELQLGDERRYGYMAVWLWIELERKIFARIHCATCIV